MTVFSCILIGILCVAELSLIYPFVKSMIPQKTNKSLLMKMICSTSFLLIGLLAEGLSHSGGMYSKIIIVGLWVGDLLLGLNGSSGLFVTGGVFFLLTHFCYITAFSYNSFITTGGRVIGAFETVFSLTLLLLFELYNRKKKISLGKLHIPVLIYGLILTTMLAKSLVFSKDLIAASNYIPAVLVFFGAFFFFVSDFTLTYTILDEKRKNDVKYKFINSLSYFGGQTLIALSIIVIK